MKRTFTFLMSLFLCIGMTMKAQPAIDTSTADAPKYYVIASYDRGGVLTNAGVDQGLTHVTLSDAGYWYFEKANDEGGVHIVNKVKDGENKVYVGSELKASTTAAVWYILPNGVNNAGLSVSKTATISSSSCIDAHNYDTGVGTWNPSASDWNGTTWVVSEEKNLVDVVYNFTYNDADKGSGTAKVATAVGYEFPPVATSFPFGISATKPAGNIAESDVADKTVTKTIALEDNLPFEYAESFEKAKWYSLLFHANQRNYLYYDEGLSYLDASKTAVDAANLDAYAWAFIGNPFDGFKVVNKLAGAEKILSSAAEPTADKEFPVMTKESEVTGNTTWDLTSSTYGEKGFYMAYAGTNKRLNKQDSKVCYWLNGADAGSTFMVEVASEVLSYTLTDVFGNEYTGTYLGVAGETLPTLSGAAGCTYDNAVWNGTALTANVVFPFPVSDENTTKAVMISSHNGTSLFWRAEGDNITVQKDAVADSENYYWAIYPAYAEGSFTFTIKNLGTGKFIYSTSAENKHDQGVVTLADEGSAFTLETNNKFKLPTGKYLSINSAASTGVQYLGTWGEHGGTYNQFVAYFGLTEEVVTAFNEQATAFAALESEALSSLPALQAQWTEVMTEIKVLDAAIKAGDYYTDQADVDAAVASMTTAKAAIEPVVTYYNETYLPTAKTASALLATLEEGSEGHTALSAAIAACDLSAVTTVAELETMEAALAEAVEANTPEADPNDYTSYIINADLATGDAWNTNGTKGISGGMVKVASESAFDFSQTITLPAGQYKMTAKAVYRYTGSEADEFAAIEAGTETNLVKLYATTATYEYNVDVMNRYDGASDTDYAAGSGSVTVNGKFVPNSSSAVQAWFDNGQYVNELVFNVQEEGQVKIGLTRTGSIAGDYANIGAWTLTRLGDAEADPEVEEPTPDPEETVALDMTHLVGTSKEAWTGNNGGPVNIDGISMPEKYETTTATLGDVMWQTVEGLYNGTYTVELWANARFTSGRGFESKAKDGDENFTYLFANNVEKSIAVYHNGGLNSNKSYTLEGVEVTDGTLKMGMTKKGEGSNWHTIQIKSLTLHATNEVIANIAKVDLKAALDAANAVSPITDEFAAAIAAAQNVYDNSTDAEEVKAAITSLKEATKLAILMNATEENPVLTDFVVNGTFDAGTTGWKSTTGAANQGTATNQQGAFTGAFFENWNSNNYTGKLYQVIENIPNGVYELSICAFVETFDGSAQFVYANADKVALTTGAPTAYTVRTIVKNNTIEVGFEQTAAVNRWCGIDNVSLTYFGEASDEESLNAAKVAFTAAYEEFGAALTACQAMMLKMSFAEIDDAAYQLNEQLETTTDVDALNTMAETLAEATASLKEINEVYAGYDVFVQKFKAAAEISEPKTTEAAELLEFHMYGGAGMQAASLEALAQAVQTIKADYFTYIANANLLDGNKFDLTFMIQNPGFEMNLDGWTCVNAGHNGGAGYNNVGGIAEIALWGAESWEASISQTLNELPNGKYIVKAAWMAASGIEMTFSANEGEASVTGIGDTGGNIDNDGNVVEMGQGFRGWQYVEVEGEVVDGTLTITVNSSSTALHTWSNADAFELYYAGVPAPVEPEYLTVVGAKVGDVALVEGAATVESISTIDVIFDRPVAKAENAGWATLADSWGPTNLNVEVLEAEEGSSEYVVRFSVSQEFNGEFTEAGEYELNIPEGFIVGAEGANYISSEITATITIEAAPATPLTVTSVTVGEDVMEGFTVVATPEDIIKVNFDGQFYFQGTPVIVDAESNDASESFDFVNGIDVDGSNSYIFMGKKAGIYTITLPKASFLEMMQWKAPAEDIVLTVQIVVEPEYLTVVGAKVGDVAIVEGAATVESISTIDVIFDRPVAKAENAGWATLADSWGPTNLNVEVLEAEEGSSEYVVRFSVSDEFGGEFTAAGDYELNIPEGFIVGAEGANYISSEITATITIEAAPATPLAVTSVTVGEDVMEGFTVVATPADMIKVNFDAEFYFSGMPTIVNAEGNDASDYFTYISAMDAGLEGNSYILQAQNWEGTVAPAGVYTITLSKASFMNMMQWKAPAEDIVLTVEIIVTGIDNINADANAVIYDIHGRRVEKMEKGIYIVNGKKVIKK